jgi:histidyl-tRNA synthetase
MGVLTLTLFLETYGLIPASVSNSPSADVYVAVISQDILGKAGSIAAMLRGKGLRVMMDVSGRKIARQFAEASRHNIPAVITVGPDDIETGTYQVKFLNNGSVFKGAPEDIARRFDQGKWEEYN